MEEGGTGDQCATDVSGRIRAVGDDAVKLALGSHLHQIGIALVEKEEGAMGPHEIIEFTFRPFYTLERSEALQVGTPYIGDHATGRLNIIHKLLYVARMGGSHLHNRYLMFRRDLKQRTRHAYIVVVVGLGVEHTVFFGQDRGNQFLGCGLTIRTRDADDRNVKLAAMLTGQFLIGGQRISHDDIACVASHGILRFINHGIATALFQSLGGKTVAVEGCTLERDEETVLWAMAAIGRHAGAATI